MGFFGRMASFLGQVADRQRARVLIAEQNTGPQTVSGQLKFETRASSRYRDPKASREGGCCARKQARLDARKARRIAHDRAQGAATVARNWPHIQRYRRAEAARRARKAKA